MYGPDSIDVKEQQEQLWEELQSELSHSLRPGVEGMGWLRNASIPPLFGSIGIGSGNACEMLYAGLIVSFVIE